MNHAFVFIFLDHSNISFFLCYIRFHILKKNYNIELMLGNNFSLILNITQLIELILVIIQIVQLIKVIIYLF